MLFNYDVPFIVNTTATTTRHSSILPRFYYKHACMHAYAHYLMVMIL